QKAIPIEINDEIVWVANPDIDGVWEGKWKCLYRIEDDGCKYSTVTAEGQGMGGELEGLKIRVYVKAPVGTGAFCGLNTFWPFEGYILDPNN
ncbi:MAG TPA: hypothetical protein PLA74_09770, partial [Syntrophales bacterium]|nr:hypothetical protein [Syntrophales bacterium]